MAGVRSRRGSPKAGTTVVEKKLFRMCWTSVLFEETGCYVCVTELTPLFAVSAGDQWPVAASFKHSRGRPGSPEVSGVFRI